MEGPRKELPLLGPSTTGTSPKGKQSPNPIPETEALARKDLNAPRFTGSQYIRNMIAGVAAMPKAMHQLYATTSSQSHKQQLSQIAMGSSPRGHREPCTKPEE